MVFRLARRAKAPREILTTADPLVGTVFFGGFWAQLVSASRQFYWTITLSAP
jgi:hypothetical protein